MDNENREGTVRPLQVIRETIESLQVIKDAKYQHLMELNHALPEIPEGGLTDEEAEEYLFINQQITKVAEELLSIDDQIDESWSKFALLMETPMMAAMRRLVSSRVDAWLDEQWDARLASQSTEPLHDSRSGTD